MWDSIFSYFWRVFYIDVMNVSNQTITQINALLGDIIAKYPANAENVAMTDINFQAKADNGELTVTDDNDEEISSNIIDEWIDCQEDNFEDLVGATLRQCIVQRKKDMEALSLLKPYSFMLIDENKETVSELYLVDDKTIIVESEELMQGLDKDLDNFIDRLLKD